MKKTLFLAVLLTVLSGAVALGDTPTTTSSDWSFITSLSAGRLSFQRGEGGHVTPVFASNDLALGAGIQYSGVNGVSLDGVIFGSYRTGENALTMVPAILIGILNNRLQLGAGYDVMLGTSTAQVGAGDIQRVNIFIGTGISFSP